MKIDLLDPRLFGNEAGDDEDEKTLASYFVEKPEFKSFESDARRLAICRARKGMGKSALLNYISYSKSLDNGNIVLKIKGQQLLGLVGSNSTPNEWLSAWRIAILSLLMEELRANCVAENGNSSIFNKEKYDLSAWVIEFVGSRTIWLCVDDIDATYRRSIDEDLRLSTFFSACRSLVTSFDWLKMRISVRQDVWASIRAVDEALDKCEQYMLDIEWSRTGTRSILAKRIKHYLALVETEALKPSNNYIEIDGLSESARSKYFSLTDNRALLRIFPAQYPWGASFIEPFHVVHVLSAGRPRWALQLARMAAGIAVKYRDNVLKYGYMKQILPKYSQFRVNDLIREHSHQCAQIEDLLHAFDQSRPTFTTGSLLAYIGERICKHIDVFIDREDQKASALEIAHFLYRVDFLEAVDLSNKKTHYHFDDSPQLLKSITAVHGHIRWEIRASYRAALGATDRISDEGVDDHDVG